MENNIGEIIKETRIKKKMTLKDVAEQTDLSIGYLSQLERGLTSFANDTIKKIGKVLDLDVQRLLSMPTCCTKSIVRSYEREIIRMEGQSIIEYCMTNISDCSDMFPRFVELLPQKNREEAEAYKHEGEEIIYVIEGILTLKLEEETFDLYPGDCAHYPSTKRHNWSNQTNKLVRLLSINTPNHAKNDLM